MVNVSSTLENGNGALRHRVANMERCSGSFA